jgi:hypothetical protein
MRIYTSIYGKIGSSRSRHLRRWPILPQKRPTSIELRRRLDGVDTLLALSELPTQVQAAAGQLRKRRSPTQLLPSICEALSRSAIEV